MTRLSSPKRADWVVKNCHGSIVCGHTTQGKAESCAAEFRKYHRALFTVTNSEVGAAFAAREATIVAFIEEMPASFNPALLIQRLDAFTRGYDAAVADAAALDRVALENAAFNEME